MTMDWDPADVPAIARLLGRRWTALGGSIAYRRTEDHRTHVVGPGSTEFVWVEDFLKRAIAEGRAVFFDGYQAGRAVAVPLRVLGKRSGSVCCLLPASLTDRADVLLGLFQDQVEQLERIHQDELELTSLSEHLAQSYEELSLIYKIGKELRVTETPQRYFERFAADLIEIIQARSLVIFVRVPGSEDSLVFFAGEDRPSKLKLEAVGRYILRLAPNLAEPIILSDLSAHPTLVQLLERADYNLIAVPLRVGDKVNGVIVAVNKEDGETFDSTDAKLIESVGEQSANFLENRFLVQDLNELLMGLLTSLVSAIDAKDPYTRGHSQRVAHVAKRVAESLNLSANETTEMYLAGLLHDIGKIGIEDAVLSKPGKLTPEEYQRVKEHPVIGARIISGIKQLRNILPGVLHHHERYDGSGYPEGLREEQIPLMGAIVAIADVFDAVTSDRTYRKALSAAETIAEIERSSGRDFSPIVVEALTRCGWEELAKELQEIPSDTATHPVTASIAWLQGS